MNFRQFFKANAAFFVPYSILVVALAIYQLLYRQGIISLTINKWHGNLADIFFKYFTHIGDGFFCIALSLVLYGYNKRKGLALLAAYAISGILAQALKNLAFAQEPRPAQYFHKMMQYIHTVDGVSLSHWNSFPSGHTTSAFALFSLLIFWASSPLPKFLYLLVAILVGFSRLYLFQHFLVDVYAGSLLGVGVACSVYYYLTNRYRYDELL